MGDAGVAKPVRGGAAQFLRLIRVVRRQSRGGFRHQVFHDPVNHVVADPNGTLEVQHQRGGVVRGGQGREVVKAAVVAQRLQHILIDRDLRFLAALADHPPPPTAANLDEAVHGVVGDFAHARAEQVEQGEQILGPGAVLAAALLVARQLVHSRQQGLPLVVFEEAFHLAHGLLAARAAAGERQRVTGQIAGLDQVAEQGVDDQHRDFAAGRVERAEKRPPVRAEARRFGAAPTLARLRVGQEIFVENTVFAGEAG